MPLAHLYAASFMSPICIFPQASSSHSSSFSASMPRFGPCSSRPILHAVVAGLICSIIYTQFWSSNAF
ncbi:unnamed protein product [Protopolystoma xenopodis]|uniref:Uncharacterized protein n=1 Tax=Protopolystoma xenopodis TaxID=117903 RepID=A0A448WS57_9PLAT|nr:unnamed protein product [Protopolystoma xenopodis]